LRVCKSVGTIALLVLISCPHMKVDAHVLGATSQSGSLRSLKRFLPRCDLQCGGARGIFSLTARRSSTAQEICDGFQIRPWSKADSSKVHALVTKVQRCRDAAFNVEGPEDDCDMSNEAASSYMGTEDGTLLVAVNSSGVILGCAAIAVGVAVSTLKSGRSVSEGSMAAVRRVCVDGSLLGTSSTRKKILVSLLEASEQAALERGACNVIALGYTDPTASQPSDELLQSLGYKSCGSLAGVNDVTQFSKQLRPNFEGRWRMDLNASDSLRDVLSAVGLNFIVARIVDSLGVTQNITQSSKQLDIDVRTLLGKDKICLPFDGGITEVPGPTGSSNMQTTRWQSKNGARLEIQLWTRQAVEGNLEDISGVIFETKRSLSDDGASLYEDICVIRDGQPVARARRILRRMS